MNHRKFFKINKHHKYTDIQLSRLRCNGYKVINISKRLALVRVYSVYNTTKFKKYMPLYSVIVKIGDDKNTRR